MTDPRSAAFWAGEHQKMWEATHDVVQASLLAGAESGLEMLPPDLRSLMSFEVFNDSAMQFFSMYQLSGIGGMNETTRKLVVTTIEEWLPSGLPMSSLIERLEAFPWSDWRTKSIAVTEVTRTFAVGNLMAWQATGFITGKRWMTSQDERVCPICGPLHMQIVSMEEWFSVPEEEKSPELARRELSGLILDFESPPAHPNCRCWLLPFVDDTAVMEQINAQLGLLE
jgi:hypothetical protein